MATEEGVAVEVEMVTAEGWARAAGQLRRTSVQKEADMCHRDRSSTTARIQTVRTSLEDIRYNWLHRLQ